MLFLEIGNYFNDSMFFALRINPVYSRVTAITDKMPNRPILYFKISVELCRMSKSSISSCTWILVCVSYLPCIWLLPKKKIQLNPALRTPAYGGHVVDYFVQIFRPLGSKALSVRKFKKSLLKNITLLDIGISLSCLKSFILSLGKTRSNS